MLLDSSLVCTAEVRPGACGMPSLMLLERGIFLPLGFQVLPSYSSSVTIRSGSGSETVVV